MMGTPGWQVIGFLALALVVLANFLREEAHRTRTPIDAPPAPRSARDEAWLQLILAARTRALARVIRERDELRAVTVRAAKLERAGWAVYKLRAQGDAPIRPSDIITAAEEAPHDHD